MADDKESKPDNKAKEKNVAGFVDELRQVLSGIGSTSVENEPEKEPLKPVEPPLEPAPFTAPDPFPVDEAPPAVPPPPDPFQVMEPLPPKNNSDADFWKGDVLGWTDTPDAIPQPQTKAPPEPLLPDPEPVLPEPEPIRPEPAPLLTDPEPESNKTQSMLPDDMPQESLLPQPPESPPLFLDEDEVAPPQVQPMLRDEEEFSIPIPGTLDKKDPLPSIPPAEVEVEVQKDKDFEKALVEHDIKPEGLVQIACIFPLGHEKAGQLFVTKLREYGEKSKKPLNIQAVFVNPWTPEKVDMEAWKKSAALSGADAVFVLAAKQDLGIFKVKRNPTAESSVRSRVIQVEQVELQTLYADIIVELQRGR